MKRSFFISALTIGILLSSSISVQAQVGPELPRTPPPVDPKNTAVGQVKSGFMKFFKKDDSATNGSGAKTTTGPLANPYGTTVPDITDAASSRTVGRQAPDPAKKTGKDAPRTTGAIHPPLLTQPPLPDASIDQPVVSEENPPVKLVTLDNPNNSLGFADALGKLNQIDGLIDKKDVLQAKTLLSPLRQWLVDSTEAHIGLYKALSNVSSAKAQAELEKQLALQFALLRDRAMFQMGTINVREKNYKSAVKDLTEVVKSQPRSEMGLKSYSMLQEIGFTEKLQIAE